MASQPKTCRECSAPIGHRSRTGSCRSCAARATMRNPEFRAKVSASLRRRMAADPQLRDDARKRMAVARQARDHEARRARFIENRLWERGFGCQPPGSEARIKAGKRCSETRLAWCPPHLREEYRHICKVKQYPAAEARRMIEDLHEAEMKRWRESIAPTVAKKKRGRPAACPSDTTFADKVLPAVSALTGVHPRDIAGDYRFPNIVRARQAVICALRLHYGAEMGFAAIGRLLGGRDHSTIGHAMAEAEKLVRSDPEFAALVAEVLAA